MIASPPVRSTLNGALAIGISLSILHPRAFAYDSCCGDDDGDTQAQVTTSACVNGVIVSDISLTGGGGYEPPGSPAHVDTGNRNIVGSGPNVLTASNKTAIVPMKPGKEYTVSWQLLSGTAASLHSRFEPKGLPSGAIFQIDDGDGNGWKEQTRIDHVGAQATNPSAAVHKFRVLPPMMRAGEISRVSMAGTKFEMRANPNTDGLALLAIDDPKEQNQQPALDVASARVTFGLGAAEENGVPITAGRLVFDADLWINGSSNLVINPSLLSYEAPANVGVDLIFDGNQWLRQVKAPEILADIVVISNTAGSKIFEVNMYLPSQLGTQPGANQPWPVSGDPISSCRIERVNSLAIPGYGGATHACRIRRYEDTVEVSDVSMGGRFTSVNTYDKFATVRQEGAETVTVFNERTFRNSTSGPFYFAGIQYSTSTGVHYFHKETTETKRDSVPVQKSIRDYLLHSIGGPGTGSPLGGFGDLLIKDANFNTTSTSEVTEIYPNFHYNTTNQQLGAYGAYNPGAFGKPAFHHQSATWSLWSLQSRSIR